MFDTFLLGDALSGAEGGERGWWRVGEFVAGEEATEMKGSVGKVVVGEPTAHLADHVHIVIDAGNDEVGELDPDAGLLHGEDGVEDGLQMAAADTMVDIVAEGLEVDVGSIEVGQEVV